MGEQLQPINLRPLVDQPLVSVITPCYNAALYIKQTVESVIAQTYSNWEMVICDDGSTDESVNIIALYKDKRIRLLKQANAGAAAATNAAYEESRGDIIAFLDADDLFAPAKLAECVKAFLERSDAGFLTHRLQGIDHMGKENGIIFPGVPKLVDGWFAPYLFDKVPTRGSAAPSAGNLVRREVLQKLMPIPLECQRTQDAYVLNAAMLLTPAIGLNQVLGSYRVHPGGQSRGVMYSEAYHLRRLEDQRSSANALRGFCQNQNFSKLADFLNRDYFLENVGYLENVIIYYLLTGKLPDEIKDENIERLFIAAGHKGQRFRLLLGLPVGLRGNLLRLYGKIGNVLSPVRNAIRNRNIIQST